MRHIFRDGIGMMCALLITLSCSQTSPKKHKRSSSPNASMQEEAATENSEIASLLKSPPPYPVATCQQRPLVVSQNRSGHVHNQEQWRGEADQIKAQLFQEIHQDGLTQDDAIQLALINNPNLMAYYENLEIAHADLIEAGLRQNPVFKKSERVPDEPGKVNKEFETSINFLDFFLIPFRENAALAELHVVESEFGQMVLDTTKEVKLNWLSVKALEMELEQEALRIELRNLAALLAELQHKAGNVSALTARNFKLEYEIALGKLKTLSADLETAREKLNRSLGLLGPDTCFPLAGVIDWRNDFALPNLVNMEQAAIENRLDVEAIRREINALAEKAKLSDPWTYANLVVGESYEQDTDGTAVLGPVVELEVPIFNDGQAARKKYHALIAQAQKKLVAKAVEVCSEVREFRKTTDIYQSQLEDLEQKILPDFKQQIADAITHYNVMTLGVFDLFRLKESEVEATVDHIHALKHYMTAKIELLHALGGHFAEIGGKE